MQPLCQISKKPYGKSTIFNNLRTAFSHKSKPLSYPQVVESTKVINSIINLYLPLLIFIEMHSQDSMLHNTCMFCSIKFIFISKNLSLHWRYVQKCLQNIRRNCRFAFDERYMFYIELKIKLFLMQPLCQISKKLYDKSTIFNNQRTAFSHKSKPHSYR